MSADNEQGDLAYVSELRFGTFIALLAAVLLVMAHLLETGLYHPILADRLWPLLIRKALPERSEPLEDSTVISLHRTRCFGWCPEYSIRIFGSGRVEYVGDAYVCIFGAHTATADPREVRRLVEAMIEAGFFGHVWKEGPFWTDSPTVISALHHQGRSYTLQHYHGDEGAPRWLEAMEDEIDRVAGTAWWLPTPGTKENGWRFQCSDPAGGVRDVTIGGPVDDRLPFAPRLMIEPPTPRYEQPIDF